MGDKNIVGLYVSVNDALGVQIKQRLPHLVQNLLHLVAFGALTGEAVVHFGAGRTLI